jgi:hypothetical protein
LHVVLQTTPQDTAGRQCNHYFLQLGLDWALISWQNTPRMPQLSTPTWWLLPSDEWSHICPTQVVAYTLGQKRKAGLFGAYRAAPCAAGDGFGPFHRKRITRYGAIRTLLPVLPVLPTMQHHLVGVWPCQAMNNLSMSLCSAMQHHGRDDLVVATRSHVQTPLRLQLVQSLHHHACSQSSCHAGAALQLAMHCTSKQQELLTSRPECTIAAHKMPPTTGVWNIVAWMGGIP